MLGGKSESALELAASLLKRQVAQSRATAAAVYDRRFNQFRRSYRNIDN
jgi:hypothetical protein